MLHFPAKCRGQQKLQQRITATAPIFASRTPRGFALTYRDKAMECAVKCLKKEITSLSERIVMLEGLVYDSDDSGDEGDEGEISQDEGDEGEFKDKADVPDVGEGARGFKDETVVNNFEGDEKEIVRSGSNGWGSDEEDCPRRPISCRCCCEGDAGGCEDEADASDVACEGDEEEIASGSGGGGSDEGECEDEGEVDVPDFGEHGLGEEKEGEEGEGEDEADESGCCEGDAGGCEDEADASECACEGDEEEVASGSGGDDNEGECEDEADVSHFGEDGCEGDEGEYEDELDSSEASEDINIVSRADEGDEEVLEDAVNVSDVVVDIKHSETSDSPEDNKGVAGDEKSSKDANGADFTIKEVECAPGKASKNEEKVQVKIEEKMDCADVARETFPSESLENVGATVEDPAVSIDMKNSTSAAAATQPIKPGDPSDSSSDSEEAPVPPPPPKKKNVAVRRKSTRFA